MSTELQAESQQDKSRQAGRISPPLAPHRRSWWSCYELYFIIFIAGFLRFYHIDRTEFNVDQADIFQMAHDALLQGHILATSNMASIGIYNPPGIIYFLLLPAAISSNPIGGAIMTAFLAVGGVLLTYVLMQRYYGRIAATVASILYAVSAAPLFYSRFMWNQNLLIFLTPLYLFFLYRGVIDRRKGWFGPAMFMVGLLTQFHASAFLLGAPLVAALLLAPGTVRIRDFVFGAVGLLVIYSTYILWLIRSHFIDIGIFLKLSAKHKAVFNPSAFVYYQQFLSPFGFDPYRADASNLHAWRFVAASRWQALFTGFMVFLLVCAVILLLYLIVVPRSSVSVEQQDSSDMKRTVRWRALRWWTTLRASPLRCSFIVLLVWQIVPLLDLSHNSLRIYIHYFILFAPGQYILVGILVACIVDWCKKRSLPWSRWLLLGTTLITTAMILIQLASGALLVWDDTHGAFQVNYPANYDLASLQSTLAQTDTFARVHNAPNVYIVSDRFDYSAMSYLAPLMHTPSTVLYSLPASPPSSCTILPNALSHPAVYLLNPTDTVTLSRLSPFMHIISVSPIPRPEGPSFQLVLAQPLAQAATPKTVQGQNLTLLSTKSVSSSSLLTLWNIHTASPLTTRAEYVYQFTIAHSTAKTLCRFRSAGAGDQLMVFLPFSSKNHPAFQVSYQIIKRYTFTTQKLGIHLTFNTNSPDTSYQTLHTVSGSALWSLPTH
jgi:hypothetical protein